MVCTGGGDEPLCWCVWAQGRIDIYSTERPPARCDINSLSRTTPQRQPTISLILGVFWRLLHVYHSLHSIFLTHTHTNQTPFRYFSLALSHSTPYYTTTTITTCTTHSMIVTDVIQIDIRSHTSRYFSDYRLFRNSNNKNKLRSFHYYTVSSNHGCVENR